MTFASLMMFVFFLTASVSSKEVASGGFPRHLLFVVFIYFISYALESRPWVRFPGC
jgi:hypothetical protein